MGGEMTRFRTRLLAALIAAALVFGFGSTVASADPGDGGGTAAFLIDPGSVLYWIDPGDGGGTPGP